LCFGCRQCQISSETSRVRDSSEYCDARPSAMAKCFLDWYSRPVRERLQRYRNTGGKMITTIAAHTTYTGK
jgi:hypothetical protein